MKKFWLAAVAALAVISLGTPVIAQKKASAQQLVIKNAVDSQQYIFVARYANPMQGGQRYLTTEYTVQVSKNSVVSFLPYFGVAYQAPINPAEGGIQFTSTAFDYTVKAGKRKTWQVSIKPADAPEVQQLTLTIFNSGEASLQVISTNKQAISYNGYIMSVKATH